MCGIFGMVAKKNRKVNLEKIKILGLFNDSRGGDSCGYYFNNTLKKGVDKEKLWADFIQGNKLYEDNVTNKVFIGHCRKKSTGTISEDSAHPFNINDRLIMAHNGTLYNHFDLAKKYNVEHKGIFVDSIVLAMLLEQEDWKILEEYRGYAALAVHKTAEPSTLYLYHGASKESNNDKEELEERPLFYLKTDEGIYYSSMSEALFAISRKGEIPYRLTPNYVCKIVDGELCHESQRIHIEREWNNLGIWSNKAKGYWGEGCDEAIPFHNGLRSSVANCHIKNFKEKLADDTSKILSVIHPSKISPDAVDLENETLPRKCFEPIMTEPGWQFIYYWKNRYYFDDGEIVNGKVLVDKFGFTIENPGEGVLELYFYNGIRLEDKQAMDALEALMDIPTSFVCNSTTVNFAREISRYAKYPVTNVNGEGEDVPEADRNVFYVRGSKYNNGSYTPAHSARSYVIKNGKLDDITSLTKTEVMFTNKEKEINKHVNALIIKEEQEEKEMQARRKEAAADVNKQMRIVKGNDGGYNVKNPKGVATYSPFFKKIYRNDKEFYDGPNIIMLALEYYASEALGLPSVYHATKPQREEISYYIKTFIDTIINDEISIYDNMANGHSNYEKFIDLALITDNTLAVFDKVDKYLESDLKDTLNKLDNK